MKFNSFTVVVMGCIKVLLSKAEQIPFIGKSAENNLRILRTTCYATMMGWKNCVIVKSTRTK